jgi:hypothetical protein
VHVADGYVLHVTHDQHGQTVLTVKSDTGCGTIATITVPAAPAAGHVRCDITERELDVLNEEREDDAVEKVRLLKQEIAHVAEYHFDANAPEAFVEHMKKLHARLAGYQAKHVTIIARDGR